MKRLAQHTALPGQARAAPERHRLAVEGPGGSFSEGGWYESSCGAGWMSMSFRDAGWTVRHLPLHHRDPFDRMLIVQAQRLGAALASLDGTIPRYDVAVLSAHS